ncbi:LysE family translocator [Gordonia crocea]|uniref:Threonine transporter RhtB n=1 Tax=Gordonia crocea TaxID=589162 RepID=A0A7I9V148_9ACTN|nr:LysE family translocator [Gordonia crocea]GED98863.1 threonine transporter RhtB [Gordonia crocea]
MTVASALVGFAAVAVLLTIVPGLDSALILRSALTRSKTYAFSTALGIQAGTLVWGAAAGVGATAVLATSETAYRILSLLGACYLVWMGVSLLVSSVRRHTVTEQKPPVPKGGVWRGASAGLLTNLLNPKVGVFYLATIPQFMVSGIPPLVMGVLLALVHCALGMVWSTFLVLGGSALRARLRSASFVRWVDRVTGGVLIAFGARLALNAR